MQQSLIGASTSAKLRAIAASRGAGDAAPAFAIRKATLTGTRQTVRHARAG
jgi:hypothetical protein